jgi:ACT domain-containing protein
MKCVVSVLGADRSGIVAAIAGELTRVGANIDDISQTILGNGEIFSMTMLVTLDVDVCPFDDAQAALVKVGESLGCQVNFQREDVFRFMYEV